MQRSTKILVGIVGTALVAILVLGAINIAYAARYGHSLMQFGNNQSAGIGPGGTVSSAGAGYGPGGMMGGAGAGYGPGGMMAYSWGALATVSPVATNQVQMTNKDTFDPTVITVRVGTTVTWTNSDTDAHTVTFVPMMINSAHIPGGSSFSYTFTSAGIYNYFCAYHQGMVGRVIVTNN